MNNLLPVFWSFLIIWTVIINLKSQPINNLEIEWKKYFFSSDENDEIYLRALDISDSGHIYIGINRRDMPPFNPQLESGIDIFSLDTMGVWLNSGGFIPFDASYSRYHDLIYRDGYIYLGGRACSGGCKANIIKYDLDSRKIAWQKSYNLSWSSSEIQDMLFDKNHIFLAGSCNSDTTGIDIFLMKLDHDGNAVDSIYLSSQGNNNDYQLGDMYMDDSFLYITGVWNAKYDPINFQINQNGRSFIGKFEKTTLSLVDSVLIGRQDNWINREEGTSLTSDGKSLYVTGNTTTQAGKRDVFITKYDKDLTQQWHRTWGNADTQRARAVTVAKNGFIYVSTETSLYYQGQFPSFQVSDFNLLVYTADGDLNKVYKWPVSQQVPGEYDIRALSTWGNGLYLAGNAPMLTGEPAIVVLKTELEIPQDTTNTVVTSVHEYDFKIWPNPTSGTLIISGLTSEWETLNIYNLSGMLVEKNTSPTPRLDLRDYHSGIYLLEFELKDGYVIRRKISIK